MKRRAFLIGAVAFAMPAAAQTAFKAIVIGRLHPGAAADPAQIAGLQAFRDGMRALGHVEGVTYRVEAGYAEGDTARLASIAAEFVRKKVDLIVASAGPGVRAAQRATTTIPIVMAMYGGDPVADGLVKSLARPGGNITGMTGQIDETPVKQIELLREIVPGLTDVVLLHNPTTGTQPGAAIAATATALGLRFRAMPAARSDEIEAAFRALGADGKWGIVVMGDALLLDRASAQITALALRHRMPSALAFRMGAEAGGLFSFAVDLLAMHRRSAVFVDKILKGAAPGELPVERPTKFELVLNQRTAQALGIVFPQSVLFRADEVIE